MPAGFRAYGLVLADPAARSFTAAGFLARLPLSMSGIGIVLLVSLTTGSFGRAGLITAVSTLTGAVTAPAWGRLIDRVGQAVVLLTAAAIAGVGTTVLIISVLLGWPLPVSLAAAAVVGLGFSSAGSCVRARWTYRLRDPALLDTAFAVEAVLDEVIFIVGPVLVTFLATAVHPALGVGVSGALGLVGAVLLALQRSTQPPVRPAGDRQPRGRLPVGILLPVAVACAALGAVFGGMEVVVVAFAREKGVLPYAGALLMAWAFGSLVAGVVTGTIRWRAAAATRFRIGAVLLACSLAPLPFVTDPFLLAGLLLVSGVAIAPTLIASVGVTQAAVDKARLTEALAWSSTGLAAGVATGAAVLGHLIDSSGSRAGFVGVVGAGVALIVAALFVRVRVVRVQAEPTITPGTADTPATGPGHRPAQSP